jgi:hypothetical protein
MRPWLLILGPLGVCLGLPALVGAQEAPLLPPAPAAPAPWEIAWPQALPTATPPTDVPSERRFPLERNPLWDIDFLLGVPIAARVGLAVFRHDEQAVLLEAMGGLDYLVIPFLAAGVRYRFVAWHTQRSELVIKPGVDAYAGVVPLFFPVPFVGVGGDVAFVFLHNTPLVGWEWGLDLGAIGLIQGGVLPLVSFILGFNF